tara:strand:+ start:850 stop:1032 length:183 start_codon:yes stop_codon:yes gene_type:complete
LGNTIKTENNSLCEHPSVYIKQHIAVQSNPDSAAQTISENIHPMQKRELPYRIYITSNGY